jgi:hypothetical protein
LSQKKGKLEKVVAYASKSLMIAQKEIPPHGRGMLCIDLGHYAFKIVPA